jgi:hypothetical protein
MYECNTNVLQYSHIELKPTNLVTVCVIGNDLFKLAIIACKYLMHVYLGNGRICSAWNLQT